MSKATSALSPAVLITGASTGIGRASALELNRRGWRVFAGVRREEDGQDLRRHACSPLTPLRLDVTDGPSIRAAAETIARERGDAGLQGLVNNAGIVVAGPIEIVPLDDLRRQLEVNVIGQLAVTQAVLPHLRQGRGRIVNVSSVSGRVAVPYLGPYAASKFALEAMSDSLRVELAPWGIQVSLIEPGGVRTPIWQKAGADADRLGAVAPPEGLRLYERDLAVFRQATAQAAARAMPVERVVRAIVHALCARRPKTRYPLGGQPRVMILLSKFLPDRAYDFLLRRALGLR